MSLFIIKFISTAVLCFPRYAIEQFPTTQMFDKQLHSKFTVVPMLSDLII